MDILGVLEITQPYLSRHSDNALLKERPRAAQAAPGRNVLLRRPSQENEPPFPLRKGLRPLLSLAPGAVNFQIQLEHH